MMSALGGDPQKQTTVLISCVSVTVTRGGEGVKKSGNFADVLKVSPLTNSLVVLCFADKQFKYKNPSFSFISLPR